MADDKKKWKDELEQDLANIKNFFRGKDKTIHLKRSDFPCNVEGMFYASLDEYIELNSTTRRQRPAYENYEMPGTDQQTSFNYGYNSKKGSYKALPAPKTPSLPPVTLDENSYKVCDSIEHMRYVVIRNEKGYHAVWLSLADEDKLETVMPQVLKTKMPCGVTAVANSQFHTSRVRPTFRAAEDFFFKGGETFSRIRSRISKALDPNYIPPNLRKLAIAATYDESVWDSIPKNEHKRLLAWLKAGCPGWYGKDPNKGWMKAHGFHMTSGYRRYSGPESKSFEFPQHVQDSQNVDYSNMVWDYKKKIWKPMVD